MSPGVGDRHADLADLAPGQLVVGVISGLRGQVERDRQAGLALLQVAPIQLVGALGVGMAGVRAHHPRPIALGQAGRRGLRHLRSLYGRGLAGRLDCCAEQVTWVWSRACLIKAQLPPSTPSCKRSPRRWRRSPRTLCRRLPTCTSRSPCGAMTGSRSTRTSDRPASSSPSCKRRAHPRRPCAARSSAWASRSPGSSSVRTTPPNRSQRSRAARRRIASRRRGSEASRITASAEQRLKDLDAETDRIWAERQQIVEDTRELARQLVGLTESAADRFPAADETPGVRAGGLLGLSADASGPGRGRAGRRRGRARARVCRGRARGRRARGRAGPERERARRRGPG